jgi:hypothetical protein
MMKTNENDRPEERPNDAQKPSDSDSLVTARMLRDIRLQEMMIHVPDPLETPGLVDATYGGPGSGPPEPYWENLLKSAAKQGYQTVLNIKDKYGFTVRERLEKVQELAKDSAYSEGIQKLLDVVLETLETVETIDLPTASIIK